MKGVKEAFIDAGEISQMLGIGMTKAYAIIKEYNAELEAKGYFTMRGKCPRKYFERKIYGYEDYYNPDYETQRNRSKVAGSASKDEQIHSGRRYLWYHEKRPVVQKNCPKRNKICIA